MSKDVYRGDEAEKEEVHSATILFLRFMPLIIFLAVTGCLLYVFITGLGPVWLRLVIMFVLVGTVLVIAAVGWREHWKEIE